MSGDSSDGFPRFKIAGAALVGIGVLGLLVALGMTLGLDIDLSNSWAARLTGYLLNTSSILAGVGATLLSIHYTSQRWYEVFSRFDRLGISSGEPNRRGGNEERNLEYIQKAASADDRIVLAGTTLGGWFREAWGSFQDILLEKERVLDELDIFLLDPAGEAFDLRLVDGSNRVVRARLVFSNIADFLEDEFQEFPQNLNIYLYDETPLPLVWIDDEIYFTAYLPKIPNPDSPQLLLDESGEFSGQIKMSLGKLRDGCEPIDSVEVLREQIELLREKEEEMGED